MKIEGIQAISATDGLPQPPPGFIRVNGLVVGFGPKGMPGRMCNMRSC